jgi:endonuclease/exonuclease/phosphatase (EEP) superfamily protein YafD
MTALDLLGLLAWCGAVGVSFAAMTALLRWCPHPLVAALQGCAAAIVPLGVLAMPIMVLVGNPWAGALSGGVAMVWYLDLRRIAGVGAGRRAAMSTEDENATSADASLLLLSANLLLVNPKPDSCAADVHALQADVVVTLETTSTLNTHLDHHMMAAYGPVLVVGTGSRGSMAAIRVKREIEVVRSGLVRVGIDELPEVVVRHAGHDIRIIGVHLHAPVTQAHLLAWRGELAELRQLAQEATSCGQHLVLAGDFNASSAHPGLRRLLDTMPDTYISRHRHLIRTWPVCRGVVPLMGIDHVLTTRGLRCPSVQTVILSGSDHRALVTRVIPADVFTPGS